MACLQQRLGGECEGMIDEASIAFQRTDGEYLKRYPKGRYVKPVLANVTDNFKYMLQEWNKPEQDASDANLKEWAVILSPQANNPNVAKALGYLKQMQGMTKNKLYQLRPAAGNAFRMVTELTCMVMIFCQ